LIHFVQNSIKEKFDGSVSTELYNVGDISPQTWKIVAHNITKSLKDSPAMISFLQDIESAVYSSVESFISDVENEPIPDLPKAQTVLHKPVNNEMWCPESSDVLQCKQLVVDTSQHRPLKVRKQALNTVLQSVLSEITVNDNWPQIQHNLRESLCEEQNEVFSLSLKVHVKLMQSPSQVCLKEGFISLVEGMHLYYSNVHYSSLPNFKNGIDLSNPIHHHLTKISHLTLEAVKEMPKSWLRYGERRVEEIVKVFVNLLAVCTYDSRFNLPKDVLCPFHILSVLDPKAKWCTHWLHGAFGQHLFLNTLSQNSDLITFLVGEILSYLETYQNDHPGHISENIISGCTVKYATFVHSLSVLSKIVCFEKGRQFFPVSIKNTSELVSLEVILVRLITYLNLESNYKGAVFTPPSGSEVVMEFIKNLLQNGDDEIINTLLKTLIEPIQHGSLQPMKCSTIPCHSVDILLHLASSSVGISCFLGNRQTCKVAITKVCRNENSTNTSAVGMRKNRNMGISLERQFSGRCIRIPSSSNSDTSSPAKVIENITTILLRNQDMSNVAVLLSLVEICSELFRIHEGLSMLGAMNSQLISTVINSYKELSSKSEPSRYCSASRYPLKSKDYSIQSEALYV
jgi:hypothetical protein